MAEETPVKGKHRKLKRIVQKKAKVGLNTSGSVSYYKKVKAALNASLNSSRIRTTLAANNRALAQSLQQARQELRNVYNENACLKVENQEMTMRLLRLEQLQGGSEDQASLEQRIRSLRSLLHGMSQHLLEVGTCLNDSIDLCCLTPRTSQGSDTSCLPPHPSDSDSNPAEFRKGKGLDVPVVEQDGSTLLKSQDEQESASAFSNKGYGIFNSKTVSLPDMSVIMEQSVIDVDEDIQVEQVQMETVLEEVVTPVSTFLKNTVVDKCKRTTDSKLPQRVPSNCMRKSDMEDKSVYGKETQLTQGSQKTKSAKEKFSKMAVSADQICHQGTFSVGRGIVGRRETFVVSKTALVIGGENEEGIDSVEMPDLVSDVSVSDAEDGRTGDKEGINSAVEQPRVPEFGESSEEPKSDELGLGGDVLNGANALSSEQKSADCKATKTCKFKKPSAQVPQCKQKCKNDSGFFISNPCALNLVHQRVTGSKDGCLTMGASDPLTAAGVSSASSFIADIKASNHSSDRIASSIESPACIKDASVGQCDGMRCLTDRIENPDGGDPEKHEPDYNDCTMYFNTDMDFTEVLPPAVGLEVMPETDTGTVNAGSSSPNLPEEKTKKELANVETEKEETSKPRSGFRKNKNSGSGDSDADSKLGYAGDEKKSAVALRVGKPGQMVFAVSRKEEDGSRKAIPAKLPTKARSKSKREIEDMKKDLHVEEPKTIFDFHDKTPQHTLDKSKAPSCIFDLSLSENVSASVPSLASLREKLNTFSKELGCSVAQEDVPKTQEELSRSKTSTEQEFDQKSTASCLLGDAPEYRLPLKMDNSPDLVTSKHGKSSSRPRNSSRGRNLQRQSRSKSRPRKEEVVQKDEDSSANSLTSTVTNTAKTGSVGGESQDPSQVRGRSRSRRRKSATQSQAETGESYEPRRSARSKSSVRKRYVEEDSVDNLDGFLNVEGEKGNCTSTDQRCSRLKRDDSDDDDDEDYKPFFEKNKRSKQRGRSRSRHKKDEKQGEDSGFQAIEIADISPTEKEFKGAETASQGCRSSKKIRSKKKPAEFQDQLQSSQPSVSETTKGCKNILAAVPDSSVNADALTVANSQVTERRHRSKSAHQKFHGESVSAEETSESIISEIPGFIKDMGKKAQNKGVLPSDEVQTDSKSRSRHSGESTSGSESEKHESKMLVQTSVVQQDGQEQEGRTGMTEKRQLQKEAEHTDCASPVPAKKGKQSFLSVHPKKLEKAEKRQHQKQAEHRNCASLLPAKKDKLSSPSLTSRKFQSGESKTTQQLDVKRETASKKGKEDSQKTGGQVDYHQQLEEVKRKLQELDQSMKKKSPERTTHPVKKSRPLVLSTFPHMTDKIQKSLVSQPEVEKTSSAHTKRRENSSCLSNSSAISSPRLSQSSFQTPGSENEGGQNGRPSRRAVSAVSYKELPLNKKLRRGDTHTSYLHKDEQVHNVRSPRSQRKHFEASQQERGVFTDLTNLSIAEAGEAH